MPELKARVLILIIRLFAWLPLSVNYRLAALATLFLWYGNSRSRRTTETNLQLCFPELTTGERSSLARESLLQTARLSVEMGASWLWPVERALALISEYQGIDLIRDARAEGRGVLVLAPHFGNWELMGLYLGQHYPAYYFYQPPKSARLDRLIRSSRTRTGAQLAATDRAGIRDLVRALKEGAVVGLLPDQEPALENGMFAPFFAHPALTMTLASRLIRKTGPLVVVGFAQRLAASGRFRLQFIAADPGVYAEDLAESVAALNRSVERCVRVDLSQYQWEYKRFKRRPDSRERFYVDG